MKREESYRDFSARLFSRTSGDHPLPLAAQFEITYRCNHRCLHCYTDPFNTPDHLRREMSFEQIAALLDQLAQAGVLWLLLTGGEAILHPRFRDIYRSAKTRGFVVSLFSNAEAVTDDLIRFLREDPPFRIEVSWHAATRETFERITQTPGSYDRSVEGLDRLAAAGLPLTVKTKAMTVNRHELEAIRAQLKERGLDFQLYTDLLPRLDGDLAPTRYRLSPTEVVALEKEEHPDPHVRIVAPAIRRPGPSRSSITAGARPTTCRADENVQVGESLPGDDRLFRCGCGRNTITIDPYGFLRPCTLTTEPSYDLKAMPLPEAFQRLVRAIRSRRYTGNSPCRACSAWLHCDKNPVMARHEAGSPEAPVPYFCELAFERQARRHV